jgi:hypothetical protein
MAVLGMTMPQLVRQAIDHGLGEHNFRFLLFAAILTILLAIVRNLVWYQVTAGYQRFASSARPTASWSSSARATCSRSRPRTRTRSRSS